MSDNHIQLAQLRAEVTAAFPNAEDLTVENLAENKRRLALINDRLARIQELSAEK